MVFLQPEVGELHQPSCGPEEGPVLCSHHCWGTQLSPEHSPQRVEGQSQNGLKASQVFKEH